MTDRELLEKAAKAAGVNGFWVDSGLNIVSDATPVIWNPLKNDGDALRLAVKLKMSITQFSFFCRAEVNGDDDFIEDHKGDIYAATRRVIVRAAAAIGESL